MNKPKPELQYKKLTKKQITIKYKQNDFKDILCSLEDENLSNNYDEMLLNRPFTEAKQKNEIKSVKIIKEEKNSLENSEEKEEGLLGMAEEGNLAHCIDGKKKVYCMQKLGKAYFEALNRLF